MAIDYSAPLANDAGMLARILVKTTNTPQDYAGVEWVEETEETIPLAELMSQQMQMGTAPVSLPSLPVDPYSQEAAMMAPGMAPGMVPGMAPGMSGMPPGMPPEMPLGIPGMAGPGMMGPEMMGLPPQGQGMGLGRRAAEQVMSQSGGMPV
jgi:hypothetical protein